MTAPGPWRYEDGGPRRTQTVPGSFGLRDGGQLEVTTRFAPVTTMVVGAPTGELYLLRHTAGDDAVAIVEQIDPVTLEPLRVSPELPGGPVWPGGLGVADDGSIHVVFGNHAHRLSPSLDVLASRTLPRHRPYNSFVPLPDGTIATKDFAGSRPGLHVAPEDREPAELLVLDGSSLEIVASLALPEPSIARLSADGDDVYVVGDSSLLRGRWNGTKLELDDAFTARYRTLDGQTYGWDCVIAAGAAWFLDNGEGSEKYDGTLRGKGVSTAPLHLVRVNLATSAVDMVEICGKPGGLVANPPVVDERRNIVVGYDSGNGVITAFDAATLERLWTRYQDHGSHIILHDDSGELVTGDGPDVLVLDVATGDEVGRADTGSGMQSVLFPCPGGDGAAYSCAFTGVARISVAT